MFESFQQAEAIILKTIPFRDYDQILTLFTSEAGVIKILHRGSGRSRGLGMWHPLNKVEVVYREKKGEIFSCQEMKLIDSFLILRKEFLHLEVACDLLQSIIGSQWLGKESPQLYALLCFYLKKIPHALDPWVLAASFRLKLLKHDGWMTFPLMCMECQKLLQIAYTRGPEIRCEEHRFSSGNWVWQREELQFFDLLANCQNYQEICSTIISEDLYDKMAFFFEACIKRS